MSDLNKGSIPSKLYVWPNRYVKLIPEIQIIQWQDRFLNMKLTILLFSLIFYGNIAQSQNYRKEEVVECGGPKILPSKVSVVINCFKQSNSIKKSDILLYGLGITLGDASFKFIGFKLGYDCHSASLFDYNLKTYLGNKVLPNDTFINRMRIGDELVIDCINIEKDGKRYLLGGVVFDVR
jgi:hypothetical protein